MDVMAALGPMAAPGAEPEVPDGRDPATAAAFTALLAGLVAPPGLRAAATAPTDGGPAAEGASAGTSAEVTAPRPASATTISPSVIGAVPPGPANEVPRHDGSTTPGAPALPATPAVRATPTEAVTRAEPATPALPATPARAGRQPEPGADRTTGWVPDALTATSGPAKAPGGPHRQFPTLPEVAVGPTDPARAPRHAARPGHSALDSDLAIDPAAQTPNAAAVAPSPPPSSSDLGEERPTDDPPGPGTADLDAMTPPPLEPAAAAPADASGSSGARGIERALAAQLVERVGTLRHREDGDYELTIELEPADLGRVELRIRLEGGVVHVQVGAESSATTDLVRRSLPELRDALVQAGLDAGTLDVGGRTDQRHHDTEPRHDNDLRGAEPPGPGRAQVPSASPVHPSTRAGLRPGVDVLL